jgi:hypothetical protein
MIPPTVPLHLLHLSSLLINNWFPINIMAAKSKLPFNHKLDSLLLDYDELIQSGQILVQVHDALLQGATHKEHTFLGADKNQLVMSLRHLTLDLKWVGLEIKYWATVSPESLKGHRYDDETIIWSFLD